MDLAEKIKEIANAWLQEDLFIVEVVFSGKKIPARLLVLVDGDKGVTIDQCAELSRHLSEQLDSTNLIESAYTLEVSTPGLDHPLKLKRQFFKNVGRQFKVHRTDKKIETGKLIEANEDRLLLEAEVKEGKKKEIRVKEIPFSEIEKAFVQVSFK
jgi:ribosome maturation factor RimP